jgi:hypothetical protein
LQGRHAFAFQVAFARARQNRLGEETMLHPKPLFDGVFQEFIFSHGHVSKVTNHFHDRKLKSFRAAC